MAKKEILNNDVVTLRVGEAVTDILDDASDAIEQTIDTIENQVDRVVTVTKNNPFLIAGAFVVGAGIGGFVAYKIAVKRTTLKYEIILEDEIEAAKGFYKRLAKDGEFSSPESAVDALVPEEAVEALTQYQGKDKKRVAYEKVELAEEPAKIEVKVEKPQTTVNVFAEHATDPRDWDWDRELILRAENPEAPYVISFEEFSDNPDHHEQTTLTYYAADDTLADEKESPIDNVDYVVGEDNLTRFGHGSNDSSVVYIRNERIDSDFEVIRSEGSYRKEVLGMDEETTLRHSQRHPNRVTTRSSRKFREKDE
jgi:hypothetical protein